MQRISGTPPIGSWPLRGSRQSSVVSPQKAETCKPATARAPRPVVLTPITLRIEALIQRMAASALPMQSNVIIAAVLHGPGRETVRRSIERLVLAKRIRVETKPGMRRVELLATGRTTDWGSFVTTGHAPFSRNARGSLPLTTPLAPRPDYKPVDGVPFRYKQQPQRLVPTTPAPTCQWQHQGLFCGHASVRGFSWCFEHGLRIFPGWERRPPTCTAVATGVSA